jgi:hypothetical protein
LSFSVCCAASIGWVLALQIAMQMEFVVPQVGLGAGLFIDGQVESSSVGQSCAGLFSGFFLGE